MITLKKPADYELAKAIAKRDPSVRFLVPEDKVDGFTAKAAELGITVEEPKTDASLFGKLMGKNQSPDQARMEAILTSRKAFSILGEYGELKCGNQYHDHKLFRDNLKDKYKVDQFDSDYEDWVAKRYGEGDTTVTEPDMSSVAYRA